MEKRQGTKRRLHGLRVVGSLLLVGLISLAVLLVRIYLDGQRDERAPADVIIVLGAAQYDGRPSRVLQARLDHALELYRAGFAPYLLFTGGKRPGDRFTEAEAGEAYARAHGVPEGAIFVEKTGRTTWQSLQASADILRHAKLRSAILVSDPFHALRLRRMARDLSMRALVSPANHSRIQSRYAKAHFILREMGIYALYRLVGM